jgi:hypothetical protein
MEKFKHKVPGAMSVIELRKQGYELTATPETAFGFTTKRGEKKMIHVMPPDFVLDRFNFTILDISHVEFKKKVLH